MRGKFWEYGIPLIPTCWIAMKRDRGNLWHIVKLIRLKRGLLNLNISNVMLHLKTVQMNNLEKVIRTNPTLANDRDLDQSKIDEILAISNCLKVIKILIFVTSISFFFAMIFKFLTNVQSDIMNWDEYRGDISLEDEPEHFMTANNQFDISEGE